MSEWGKQIMHLPWQSHMASGSVVQRLSELGVISQYSIPVNRHVLREGKKKNKTKKIQPKISFWTDLNLSVLNIWRQFHSLAILQAPYLILRTFVFHFLLDNFVQYTLGLVLEKTATLSSVFLSWLSTSLLYDSLAADYWITSIYVSSFVPLIMLVMHLLFHEHRNMETWKKKCFRA